MKFAMIVEAHVPPGITHYRRYKQMIDEAVLGEEAGFDFWGASEQHLLGSIGMSSTETMFAAVAMRTHRIRLRHMIRLLLKFNHPITIAEQIATLDLISDGRAELGTGRANNIVALNAFQVDPAETRPQWRESLEVIVKALSGETFSHKGKYWDIAECCLTPKALQYPHPPLSVASTSFETTETAGKLGIGCLSFDNYFGWDRVAEAAKVYFKSKEDTSESISSIRNDTLSFLVLPAFCAKTKKEAYEIGGPTVAAILPAIVPLYKMLAEKSKDYGYMAEIVNRMPDFSDLDKVVQHTPGVMLGTPEYFIEQITRLQELGYDEVILRVDGLQEHKEIMKSIDLIGNHVIPHFKMPANIIKPSQDMSSLLLP